MKRILIFAAYFYPHVGGYEKNIRELSRRLVQRGYEVDILTCNTEKVLDYEELDGIPIYRLPCWNALNSAYPIPKPSLAGFKILRKLLGKKYDIINTQTRFFITSFLGLLLARVKRTPLVHTERGAGHSIVSSKVIALISRAYDHTIGSLIVKSARRNVGISEAACNFLKHLGARNIKLIYNGIDTTIFSKKKTDYRQKLGISVNTPLITFVGRLIYAKGAQDLISVFPRVKKAIPRAKLLIVGDGSNKVNLEELAHQSQYSSDIVFLGQREQSEVIDILNITDAFVNPSYSEGLGTSVMEAASMGLAIVATDVGAIRETIKNRKTGLLIKAGDLKQLKNKVCQLLDNAKMRRELGANARVLVKQKFDWDKVVDCWISCYESVIGVP